MAIICPTVTAQNNHQYREQIERVSGFARRVHLDFADGQLAPVRLMGLEQAWPLEGKTIDLHLMFKNPAEQIETALKLNPNLIIIHAEAEGNFLELAESLHKKSVKVGVALLPKTEVAVIEPSLEVIDHVLIFSGDLGHFGGQADLELLGKVSKLKELKPEVEVGWDGGINRENVQTLAKSGVDVLNVGGFIHHAEKPQEAYATLEQALTSGHDREI